MSNVRFGQKGYKDFSMSLGAVNAYNHGEKPLSRFTKNDATALNRVINEHTPDMPTVTVITMKRLLAIWGGSSEHHTSKRATRTEFYHPSILFDIDPDPDWAEDIAAESIETFRARYSEYLRKPEFYNSP